MGKERKRVYPIQSTYMEQYEMKKERASRRKQSLFKRLIAAGIIMLVIVAFVTHYHIGQRATYSAKLEQYDELQAELKQLKSDEKELKEEITLLKDDEYILDIARTNYFLSKEGELIFQLEDFHSSY